jgi:hypothetical protein
MRGDLDIGVVQGAEDNESRVFKPALKPYFQTREFQEI